MILYRTIHGSHLYGLNHPGSDLDYYTVISNKDTRRKATYAKQTIVDGLDSTVMDLSTFRKQCDAGVPQALEALFSQEPSIDLLTDFRRSYRVDTPKAVVTYKRTIKNFSFEDEKHRRHAARLCLNLDALLTTGRFNPRLCTSEKFFVYDLARSSRFEHFISLFIGE